ncbi:MAG: ABC transporter ATP-binding protein [Candidatus Sabulitectum sp.]|nr:ABC transporter ATP-binding protein [Candidatus Sabulitectum sp.]
MIDLKNISYAYPFQNEKALNDVSLQVHKGEVVLLTGESGCGKSTIAKVTNGLIPHYFKGDLQGKALINQINSSDVEIGEISQSLGTLFQDPEQQFFCNDVYSELAFADEVRGVDPKLIYEKVARLSKLFEIENVLDSSIYELSEGEKQKVALASIIVLEPNCLVLDEPTANLSPEATENLGKEILRLKKDGFSILIVDHRLYWLSEIADRVLVMKNGEVVMEGAFSILESRNLRTKYGLREYCVPSHHKSNATFSSGLEVRNLSFGYGKKPRIFTNYSVSMQAGKVTAIRGANGVGKTTFSRLLTGLLKANTGVFLLDRQELSPNMLLSKTSLVLQNMDHQLYSRTVIEEVEGNMELLKRLRLNNFSQRHPQSLSGGQKQRLAIASAICRNPEVIILDEPTSGLDGENMRIIGDLLRVEAEKNKVIIVITHDLEFIDKCCDEQILMKAEK